MTGEAMADVGPHAGFSGMVAVVTGGARGIGRTYCESFAYKGATVVVADILGDAAMVTARDIEARGRTAVGMHVDVGDDASVASLFEEVERRFGRVDFLVNNAAIMLDLQDPFKPFWETTWEEWVRVMNVNAGGIFLCCKYAKPMLARQRRGRIVNITSDAIWKGYDLQLAYFASKGAVAVMTRSLAREFGQFEVNVNAVAPGYTESEAVLGSRFMQETAKPSVHASLAIKRVQRPEDLAGAVLFLCGPDSACITGQTIVVNLGAVMP